MERSRALLSRNRAPSVAIVFVHGLAGDASTTWEAFPSLVREMPEAKDSDAYMFGYPSLEHPVEFSAAQFSNFLSDLLKDPARTLINPSLPSGADKRRDAFRYQSIVICAHSMGAVVARRVIIELDQNGDPGEDVSRVRMLLFAPAHKGSNLPLLLASGFGLDWLPGGALAAKLLYLRYRSLDDLATGSEYLRDLLTSSRQLRESRIAKGLAVDHLRATVLHAQKDRVVVQCRFDDDPIGKPIMRRNHRSVCKPDNYYLRPLELLRVVLRSLLAPEKR